MVALAKTTKESLHFKAGQKLISNCCDKKNEYSLRLEKPVLMT